MAAVSETEMAAVVTRYEEKLAELGSKLSLAQQELKAREQQQQQQQPERDKYKSLAKRLKEERNQLKVSFRIRLVVEM